MEKKNIGASTARVKSVKRLLLIVSAVHEIYGNLQWKELQDSVLLNNSLPYGGSLC